MECRLCLNSSSSKVFYSINDDSHPLNLIRRIWTCCQLLVRKGDGLPDVICHSCVNNLEKLDSFRNACLQSDETSRMRIDKSLNVKTEEVWLDDLTWEDMSGANLSSNISSQSDDGELHGEKNTSDDNRSEMIDAIVPGEKLPLQKISDKICPTHSELDHTINSQSFSLEHYLVTKKTSHTQEKQYECDICLKSLVLDDLTLRMKCHTTIRIYKCNICLKTYIFTDLLLNHLRKHSKVKPFKCEICPKSLSTKNSFRLHMNAHRGIKPYNCKICPKSFTTKAIIVKHMNFHAEKHLQCNFCFKFFFTKLTFDLHMRIHLGLKSHICDICSESFYTEEDLGAHVKIHT